MAIFSLEEFDREHAYCDALLLEFKELKVYDLSIPSAYDIYSLVNLSFRVLSGEKILPSEVNCLTTSHDFSQSRIFLRNLESVLNENKLASCLYNSLTEHKDESSLLSWYLSNFNSRFSSEWFPGKGDWYKFRTGEREKAENRVSKYIPALHIKKINIIGDKFQEYIGLTNSPCKINY
jgi:hypothetical protein